MITGSLASIISSKLSGRIAGSIEGWLPIMLASKIA
jgi:hypothetical protein